MKLMEKNSENLSAGMNVSGGDNLYPDLECLPAKITEESGRKKADTELITKIGLPGLLYAVFFTFCLYKNCAGITYPFYAAGTVCFCIYTIKSAGISWKGENFLVLVPILLLGISTCLTDNDVIHLMNKTWMFVLFFYFVMRTCFQTKGWQLGKYLEAVLGALGESIGAMFNFFPDIKAWSEERKGTKNPQLLYILTGVGCSVPLIAVVILLLSSADAVFRKSMDTIFVNIKGWDIFCCMLWTVGMFFISYGIASFIFKGKIREEVKDHRTGQPVIAISATAVIAFIYVYFCGIQIVYLFAGYGRLPAGYTYAQYAREGFFQLLFVCLMNLGLMLAGLGFFRESKVLKGILFIISLCTFVMIASGFYRMLLYICAYNLTFLRVMVMWALCVIAFLTAGMILRIFKNNFPLFGYSLVVITCCYLVLSFARPDYWIARYNVAQEDTSHSDRWYLNNLSADAAPVIMTEKNVAEYKAYEEWRKNNAADVSQKEELEAPWCYEYINMQKYKAEKMTLRSYNFSKGYVRSRLN